MATWTIRTHYKKSCEQIEYYYNRKIPGAKIIVRDGFRRAEFTIETTGQEYRGEYHLSNGVPLTGKPKNKHPYVFF